MNTNDQKATLYLLLIMVDNAFLFAPAISSFASLWIVQVRCNSGVWPRFIEHVLNWLQCNRERVALDPPSWRKGEQEALAWSSQNWMNGTEKLQQSAELIKKPTGMLSHTQAGTTTWCNLIPFLRNKRGYTSTQGLLQTNVTLASAEWNTTLTSTCTSEKGKQLSLSLSLAL